MTSLWVLQEKGATLSVIEEQQPLLDLAHVKALALEQGLKPSDTAETARVALLCLRRAAEGLTEPTSAGHTRGDAAQYALGLIDGTAEWPRKRRLVKAAETIGIVRRTLTQPRNNRSHLLDLVTLMAARLLNDESEYRFKEAAAAIERRREPAQSRLRVDWVPRFEAYYRVWSPITGIELDIDYSRAAASRGDSASALQYALSSLHHYAEFLTALQTFHANHGGMWLTPDPDREQAIGNAVWWIQHRAPFTQMEDSCLRLAYAEAPELATFVPAIAASNTLFDIAHTWTQWLTACSCPVKENAVNSQSDCNVHRTVIDARAFCETLDKEWDDLADWYARPRTVAPILAKDT